MPFTTPFEQPTTHSVGPDFFPLKIAQVATADKAIVLLRDHVHHLMDCGHDVTVICSSGPWVERARQEGIRVEVVEMAREVSPLRDLASLYALYRCFRKHRFDVVHTHTPKAGLLGPLAGQLARIPVVVHTIHGLLFHDGMPAWKARLFWVPEKATAVCADYLLSQSYEDIGVATQRRLCRAQKLRYLGNGIDVTRFSPALYRSRRNEIREKLGFSPDDFVVGSVGRLVYEKGFRELFEAAEILTSRHVNIKFLTIGPQEEDQNDAISPQTIASLRERGVISFLGWQDDMPGLYSAMDLFVLPSYREGIPRACMEAAAMELPVIATRIRGCREAVKDGETGVLIPARDATALISAIERIVQDRTSARELGRRAREHIIENFSSQQVLQRLEGFYAGMAKDIARVSRRNAAHY